MPAALAPAKPGDYFDPRFDAEEDAIVFRRFGGRESWLAVMRECPDVICQPAKKNADAKVLAWLEADRTAVTRALPPG